MKRLSLFGALLVGMGLTGSGFAQTAAQYIAAGNQSYAAKDYSKGTQYYQAATRIDPHSAAAYQGLGNCEYLLGRNSEALTAYEKALNLNPNNAQLSSFVQTLRAKVGTSSPAAPAASSQTSYSPSSNSSSSANKFELAPFVGLAYSTETGYGIGFGGGVGGFIAGGGGLSFGGTAAFYTFGGPSSAYSGVTINQSISNIEVLAALKYHLGTGSMKPYLIAAGGLSLFSLTASASVSGYGGVSASQSTTNPMVQGGVGLEFAAGSNMSIFVEGKGSIIIGSGGTSTYLPITAGLSLSL